MNNWQKTVTAILATMFCFFTPYPLFAQYYEVSLSDKIINSSLSIEGVVLESVAFKDSNRIYTSHKVEVKNCFDIASASVNPSSEQTCDSIYIVTNGGHFGDEVEDWAHGLKLSAGDVGLFFLRGTSRPALYSDHPSYEAYSEEQGFIRYNVDDKRNFVGNNVFHTYTDPETDLIEPILTQSGVGYSGEQSFIRDEWALCFLAHNFTINGDTLYFDISAKSVWGNPFAIKNLSLVLSYDSTFLGSAPLTSGVLDFVEDDSLVSDATQFSYTQNTDSSIGITISKTTFTGIQFGGLEYQRLFTAKVDLQGTPIGNISIPELAPLSSGYSIFDRNGNEKQAGEGGIEIGPGDNISCLLGGSLDSIEPGEVGAGVIRDEAYTNGNAATSGIVTLKGCGFGDLDDDNLCDVILNEPAGQGHRVEFRMFGVDAWVTPLCTNYYKWDDDEIVVEVPSIGHKVTYFIGIPSVFDPDVSSFAQTGNVRVRTPGANPSGEKEVTVNFVHWNGLYTNDEGDKEAIRALLKGQDVDREGYELYFTDAFKTQFGVSGQEAFIRALNEWRCSTLVNFEIKEYDDIVNKDFACAIDYGEVSEGTQGDVITLAVTHLSDNLLCSPNQVDDGEIFIRSFKIVFSDEQDWHTGTSDVPANKIDLETVALHELGHAHMLFHVVNDGAVMQPHAARQRRKLTQEEIDGGIHIVQASNQAFLCDHPMIPIAPGDCIINHVKAVEGSSFFKVSPNPVSDVLAIDGLPFGSTSISVKSIHGQHLFNKKIDSGDKSIEIDVSGLPPGAYTVSVQTKNKLFTQKIIKL